LKQEHLEKLHDFWKHRSIPVCVLASVLCVSLATMGSADALQEQSSTSDSVIVADETVKERDWSSKLIYVGSTDSGHDTELQAGQNVCVDFDGAAINAQTQGETISELLNRLHLTPGADEMVLVDLSGSEVQLKIASDFTYEDQFTEAVTRETKYVKSVYLNKGTTKVVEEGADGTQTATYQITYSAGKLASKKLLKAENNTSKAKVVAVGTVVPAAESDSSAASSSSADSSVTSSSGKSLSYSAVKTMSATAYTKGYGGVGSITASGTVVHVGVVAVDPSVIPLGSKLYIVASNGSVVYGYAVAEDTGVRGNNIDLYYNTYTQCKNFGRRTCKVYILK